MEILFRANNLYEIVTLDKPELERTDKWKQEDAIAQKTIITTMDKRPLLHLINCKSAFEMWIKIKTIFQRDNEQQKCNLLQNFYGLAYNKETDMATYISKLKNIA
jgi:hypothetical protein